MSSDSLLTFAIGFSILLALFPGGCGLSLFLTEPSEDRLSDWPDSLCGDLPRVPGDDESLFHVRKDAA